jgi:hypothetical protein
MRVPSAPGVPDVPLRVGAGIQHVSQRRTSSAGRPLDTVRGAALLAADVPLFRF